jgi:putative addiction module antidote
MSDKMLAFKVTTVGNSEGFILPREARERLGVQKGDTVYLTEAPDKSYRLTAHNPKFAAQMAAFDEVMREDRDILRALAKR